MNLNGLKRESIQMPQDQLHKLDKLYIMKMTKKKVSPVTERVTPEELVVQLQCTVGM